MDNSAPMVDPTANLSAPPSAAYTAGANTAAAAGKVVQTGWDALKAPFQVAGDFAQGVLGPISHAANDFGRGAGIPQIQPFGSGSPAPSPADALAHVAAADPTAPMHPQSQAAVLNTLAGVANRSQQSPKYDLNDPAQLAASQAEFRAAHKDLTPNQLHAMLELYPVLSQHDQNLRAGREAANNDLLHGLLKSQAYKLDPATGRPILNSMYQQTPEEVTAENEARNNYATRMSVLNGGSWASMLGQGSTP